MTKSPATVGVLALQGCVDPHLAMLEKLGVRSKKVRSPEELSSVDRLIMPGGESTTMLKLLGTSGLLAPLKEFAKDHPIWGICAGAILCAKEVVQPSQASLGFIDIRAHRNFYGSQLDSFRTSLDIEGLDGKIDVDFIRAPLLEPIDPAVKVLSRLDDKTAVLLRQGHFLVSAFHSELGTNPELHRYFIEEV